MSCESCSFICLAQRTAVEPQDCNWPFCGCDPKANKILNAIDEAGYEIVKKKIDVGNEG